MSRMRAFALGLLLAAAFGVVVERPPATTAGLGAIRVPEGFEIERAAGADLVSYPMLGTIDDRGRLFLCESSGHTLTTPQMAARPDYRIRLVEDTDGDGIYDRSKVFADRLTLPAGAVWLNGSLYVAAPPALLRFDDTNNDGVADRREVVLTGWNLSANAASLHGPFLGPDGWLYLTDGRHGFKIQTKEGPVLEGKASRIWRSRPDGTGLEWFAGGGFDNPVEVVFTPAGEVIGTMTYFTDPKDGQRDALLHFVEGGVYPKWHPFAAEFPRTGDLMPVMTKFARIAPSGLERYRRAALGPGYQDNLFSAHFNSHRVERHKLFRDGATFRTEDEDFLTSIDPDFHPTDVMEDRDGSLLVVDTGAWFIHGCPISRLSKPQIKGGIYRVRRAGAARKPEAPPVARADAVFGMDAAGVRAALGDRDLDARIAAARVAGMKKDRAAVERLMEMVRKEAPPVRRQAATALGQIGDKRAVSALLAAAAGLDDRFIEHAIIFSLMLLREPAAVSQGLRHPDPAVKKAALIALDQMEGRPLGREQLVPLLGAHDKGLRSAALWVASRHADWSPAFVEFLRARLRAASLEPAEAEGLRDALVALASDPSVQAVVAEPAQDPDRALLLLEVMGRASLKEFPAAWTARAGEAIAEGNDARVRMRAIALVRSRGLTGLEDRLERITTPDDLRVAALGALVGTRPRLDPPSFRFLTAQLAAGSDAVVRQAAAQVLGRAEPSDEQLLALARGPMAQADPLVLPALLEAFRHARSEVVGEALAAVLVRSPAAASSVGVDRVRQLMKNFPPKVQAAARPVFARFEIEQRARIERLRKLEPLLTAGGDAGRGRQVFFGPKVACSSCHTMGVEGGHVGPDLTAVGAIRSPHDLLEAIVFPSASFVPGHEIYRVETANDVISGVLVSRTPEAVVLTTGPDGDVRIPRSQVKSMKPSPVSLMPEGLDESLSPVELADLLAFLQSQKSRETAQLRIP